MAKGQIHLTHNGPELCRADPAKPRARGCPFDDGGHFSSIDEAQTAFAAKMEEELGAHSTLQKARSPKTTRFSLEDGGFYGEVPPRSIQIDAMNATAEALLEDGNTQLVAACGTGKSYMGRQLMRRMMDEEDANGVAIVLTSSVKLATDTAADLRPDGNGNYDRALGELGKDYEVEIIEVHHEATAIKEDGAISVNKIAEDWKRALDEGKRVVVISTYQSSDKVRQVQELIGERAEADLLMNDEAHNILGQKKSVSSSEDSANSGYKSFDNEIPGSIQAKHRLYATATPSLADSPEDDETSAKGETREEQIASLREQATRMTENGKERLTVYSDDEHIVGKVSGAITQQEAISEGYLAKPNYQLRDAQISGDPSSSPSGFVNAKGRYSEDSAGSSEKMTVQTYSAVNATLSAMVEDHTVTEGRISNPTHNALVYAGSISQAKAFRDNFREVALEQSGHMSLKQAESLKDSPNEKDRRRARLRLLAEHGQVLAAHSGASREDKAEKTAAFSMFKGKSFTGEDAEGGWSPHKRVLANVDIFSEGISINEIDTVIIADQAKTSERAMTQGIGRALRTIGDNDAKNVGHVIIPRAINENGKELNGGFVAAASYGATRVERSLSTRKLKGEEVSADVSTTFATYSASGVRGKSVLAADVAKTHVKSPEDLIASQAIERADVALRSIPKGANALKRADAEAYRRSSKREQAAMQQSYISVQASNAKVKDSTWGVANRALSGVSANDVATIRQSGRVVTSALSAGDFSAVPASVTDKLSRAGIIRKKSGTDGPTVQEKRNVALKGTEGVAAAFATLNGQKEHPEVAAYLSNGVNVAQASLYSMTQGKRGSAEDFNRLVGNYRTLVSSNDDAVEKIYSAISLAKEGAGAPTGLHKVLAQSAGMPKTAMWAEFSQLKESVSLRAVKAAASGSSEYELDPSLVSKNGTLKASAQKMLAEIL